MTPHRTGRAEQADGVGTGRTAQARGAGGTQMEPRRRAGAALVCLTHDSLQAGVRRLLEVKPRGLTAEQEAQISEARTGLQGVNISSHQSGPEELPLSSGPIA